MRGEVLGEVVVIMLVECGRRRDRGGGDIADAGMVAEGGGESGEWRVSVNIF